MPAFNPEEVKLLGDVFDGVIRALNPAKPNDALAQMAALRIIELASAGERDPERLLLGTLASLRLRPPSQSVAAAPMA